MYRLSTKTAETPCGPSNAEKVPGFGDDTVFSKFQNSRFSFISLN